MREELDRRFTERFFAWTPYLHRELKGEIQATGFRYVGDRSSG